MRMKTQLEHLRRNEMKALNINHRLLHAISEEVLLQSKERNGLPVEQQEQDEFSQQQQQDEGAEEEEEESSSHISTTSMAALLKILCTAMHSSSSTLQEVWINDDMILHDQSKNNSSDDNSNNKEEEGGQQLLLLHTLTMLPRLERLRFYISATIAKSELEAFMRLVAPMIRACKGLQSLHFCMSNSSLPAPQQGDADGEVAQSILAPLIPTGCCFTPTALHTLASLGLENHASLTEFGLQDVVIVGHEQAQQSNKLSQRQVEPFTSSCPSLQFPLDPILVALSSLPKLETVDISLSKPVVVPPQRHRRLNPSVAISSSSSATCAARRPCFFSGRALATLFSRAKVLQDVTLWDVGLADKHLDSLLPALQYHESLQFLSLRGNPGLTRAGWSRFHKDMLLPHNFTLRSLFHDGGFGDDIEKAMDLVLYWNMLGRGRLFESCSSQKTLGKKKKNMVVLDDWIDMLETVNDDLSSLYYFVRQGNALLMPSSSSTSS